MPQEDDLSILREEIEILAGFLHTLQGEYARIEADFAAVLQALGDQIELPATAILSSPPSRHIERTENPATGTITFRLEDSIL